MKPVEARPQARRITSKYSSQSNGQYTLATYTCISSAETNRLFYLKSSGEDVELELRGAPLKTFIVTGADGVIVRTVTAWLRSLAKKIGLSIAEGTVEQYAKIATYLCRWIEANPPVKHASIDENILLFKRDDLVDWLHEMQEEDLAPGTIHAREAATHEFMEWLTTVDAGQLRSPEASLKGRNDIAGYVTSRPSPKAPEFFGTEHVIELLNELWNECERVAFHTQFDLGLRITELGEFTVKDLPDEKYFDKRIEYFPVCIRGVKGRAGQAKNRITLISRATLRRIKAYHNTVEYRLTPDWDIADPDKPVFLTANRKRWTSRNLRKQFKAAVHRADLSESISTHILRHGAAFSVLMSDSAKDYVDKMLLVQKMFGHARMSTTEIYTRIPADILLKLTKAGRELNRLEESERIRTETYLGPLQHKERRGHRGRKRISDKPPA